MRVIARLFCFALATIAAVSHADTNSEIYNGIIAEAKIPDSSAITLGRQGGAKMFVAALNSFQQIGNARISPISFNLTEDSSDGVERFVGEATITYTGGPVCTQIKMTTKGYFPTIDGWDRNIFVKEVNLTMLSSQQCL